MKSFVFVAVALAVCVAVDGVRLKPKTFTRNIPADRLRGKHQQKFDFLKLSSKIFGKLLLSLGFYCPKHKDIFLKIFEYVRI